MVNDTAAFNIQAPSLRPLWVVFLVLGHGLTFAVALAGGADIGAAALATAVCGWFVTLALIAILGTPASVVIGVVLAIREAVHQIRARP